MMEFLGGLSVIWVLFLLILGLLWFLLPFAVFGTKDRLRDLIEENRRTNQELAAIRKQLAELQQQMSNNAE
ncbi:hypothetical protein Q7C_1960 [Methylophaga frappieri]|uniref:Uncharacterized protein n=1 Tax=Methylophaga frappieri (strain ATCC BAA-2434 / DSM 25690 / JAM7) TaxID=754477 RepID=I1YJK7_METFJ|nr:hypothetical protein [Methylophaga frappieri]AFJ03100.1 hypothetical protein Q7C_1960 [Methylophaga frappieri]